MLADTYGTADQKRVRDISSPQVLERTFAPCSRTLYATPRLQQYASLRLVLMRYFLGMDMNDMVFTMYVLQEDDLLSVCIYKSRRWCA